MRLNPEDWFGREGRNIRGYNEIHDRLYFIEKAELNQEERQHEVGVVQQLINMIPTETSRALYKSKLDAVDS